MTFKSFVCRYLVLAAVVGASALSAFEADAGPIHVQHSKLTVFVNKGGLFSALADNHVINAPIARGTIASHPPIRVRTRSPRPP